MYAVKAYAAAIIGNEELYRRNRPIDEAKIRRHAVCRNSAELADFSAERRFSQNMVERLSKLHHDWKYKTRRCNRLNEVLL